MPSPKPGLTPLRFDAHMKGPQDFRDRPTCFPPFPSLLVSTATCDRTWELSLKWWRRRPFFWIPLLGQENERRIPFSLPFFREDVKDKYRN